MPVEHHGLQTRLNVAQQLQPLVAPVELEHRVHPFAVRGLDGELADPLLAVQEILEGPRQFVRFHQIGVVLGHAVAGIDAIPALIGVARLGHDVLGVGWFELQGQIFGNHVHRARIVYVP